MNIILNFSLSDLLSSSSVMDHRTMLFRSIFKIAASLQILPQNMPSRRLMELFSVTMETSRLNKEVAIAKLA